MVIVALSEGGGEPLSAVAETTGRPFPGSFRKFVTTLHHMPEAYSLGLRFDRNDITVEALCRFENDSRRAAFVERVGQIGTTAGEQLAAEQSENDSRGDSSRRGELMSAGQQTLEALRVESGVNSARVSTVAPCDYLIERDLLRMHLLATTPFNFSLQDTPRLMLGLERIIEED